MNGEIVPYARALQAALRTFPRGDEESVLLAAVTEYLLQVERPRNGLS